MDAGTTGINVDNSLSHPTNYFWTLFATADTLVEKHSVFKKGP